MDRVQFRRDTAENWQKYNPVLMEGEMGLVTDNPNHYKIGDGVNNWNDLQLRGYTGTIAQEFGDDENSVISQKTVTEKFTELDNVIAIKTIKIIEQLNSKYIIEDGTISSAIEAYNLQKIHVSKGVYYLFTTGSESSKTLCKYTDDTFTTPEKEIIGQIKELFYDKITLEEGYYAFCWHSDKESRGFIVDEDSFLAYLYNNDFKDIPYLKNSITFANAYNIKDIEVGKYISDDGSILQASNNSYRLVKMYLREGFYYIYNIFNPHPILYEYKDEQCTIPLRAVLGYKGEAFYTFLKISKGYYAFCWQEAGEVSDAVNEPLKKAFIISDPFIDLIYRIYINILFKGIYIKDFIFGYSINRENGSIGAVSYSAYKLVKMFLTAGTYELLSPGSSTQGHFWKYTDDTFATPEKEIISDYGNISVDIQLEEGYYAFCWNDGKNSINIGDIKENAVSLRKIKEEQKQLYFHGVSIIDNIVYKGKSINSESGQISNAIGSYKLVKIFISKGTYLISTPGSNTQHTLWKYTDNTFSTPERKIFGKYLTNSMAKIVSVEDGYYALCWSDGNVDNYKVNAAYIIPCAGVPLNKIDGHSVYDFSEFNVLNEAFSISLDYKSATSLLTGYANRIEYNTNLFEDKFILSSKITPLTADIDGNFEFCMGKWYNLSGTTFGIGKDANGSFISVYLINNTGTPILAYKYRITEFQFKLSECYFVKVQKITEQESYYIVTVTNKRGVIYTKNITATSNEEDTENEGNGSNMGYAWGKICCYSLKGTMSVSNISFGYPINKTDIKLVISGHSFIEGNSISKQKDKRFAALISKDLGNENTIILGQGGASVNTLLGYLNKVLGWLSNAEYLLFCIGTNDADSDDNANKLGEIDNIAQNHNIKTIWLTIPPRNGVGDDHPIMNAYIKEHFNYVDISPAFYTDEGALDASAYLDVVHPTVATHERIYEIIKAQCTYLYCL